MRCEVLTHLLADVVLSREDGRSVILRIFGTYLQAHTTLQFGRLTSTLIGYNWQSTRFLFYMMIVPNMYR